MANGSSSSRFRSKRSSNIPRRASRSGFQYGSISPGMGSVSAGLRGGLKASGIATPRYKAPRFGALDMSGVNTLQTRLDEANRLAANPLASPGASQMIANINTQLARQAESERGSALGRATGSGQAGFAGALSQTAGDIVARQGEASAGAQADLAFELTQQYRNEGLSLSQALSQARTDIDRMKTEREGIRLDAEGRHQALLAETRMRQAEIEQRNQELHFNNLLEQARLAEQSRQFNASQEFDEEKFRSGFDYQASRDERDDAFRDREFSYRKKNDEYEREQATRRRAREEETENREFDLQLYGAGLTDLPTTQERLGLEEDTMFPALSTRVGGRRKTGSSSAGIYKRRSGFLS